MEVGVILLLLLSFLGDVENGMEPKTKVPVSLERNLTLGGIDAEDLDMFSSTTSIVPAEDGTMYVLDSGNFRVVVYNKDGEYVRHFGNKGPGPGEFSEPVAMSFDDKGNLMIFDTGTHRMSRMKVTGEFIEQKPFANNVHGLYRPVGLPGGGVALTCYTIGRGFVMKYVQAIWDKDMKEEKRLLELSIPKLDVENMNNNQYWVDFLRYQLEIVASGWPMQVVVGDRLLTMRTHDYLGNFHDWKGNRVSGFKKAFKPKVASDEARELLCEPKWQDMAANPAISEFMKTSNFMKAMDDLESLERLPPAMGVASVKGGFAVLADYNPVSRKGAIDIFNVKGELKASMPYEGTYHFFTGAGNYVYTVGPDEDDAVVVERYKIKGLEGI